QAIQMAAQHLVEQKLGIAVDVQRCFVAEILDIQGTRTVNSGGRRIQERDTLGLAILENFQRHAVIVIHHELTIALGGVRTCTLVQHSFNIGELIPRQTGTEIVLVHIVGNLAMHQIDELVAIAKVIHHQNVGHTLLVQAFHQIAANKASATGHYDHANSFAVTMDVPNFPTTIPPARFAQRMACNQSSPAARMTANVANTVSPAPETSNTSCAWASTCSRPCSVNKVMPCSERVISKHSKFSLRRKS